MVRHLLRDFQLAAVAQVLGDASGAERVKHDVVVVGSNAEISVAPWGVQPLPYDGDVKEQGRWIQLIGKYPEKSKSQE